MDPISKVDKPFGTRQYLKLCRPPNPSTQGFVSYETFLSYSLHGGFTVIYEGFICSYNPHFWGEQRGSWRNTWWGPGSKWPMAESVPSIPWSLLPTWLTLKHWQARQKALTFPAPSTNIPLQGISSAAGPLPPGPWASHPPGNLQIHTEAASQGWSRRSWHCPRTWCVWRPNPARKNRRLWWVSDEHFTGCLSGNL